MCSLERENISNWKQIIINSFYFRIVDDQDPSEESDSEGAGGLNKHRDRKPKPETLVLDLPEQLDQSETSEEELTKENFYQKWPVLSRSEVSYESNQF